MIVPLGDTYYFKFTTRIFTTGVPGTLGGTPVLSVYEENNATQITTGVSITADYDSVTGLNEAAIVATTGNGYEVGKYYDVVITTGTVSSVSVVGEVVGHFRCGPAEDAGAGIPDVNVMSWNDVALATTNPLPNTAAGAAGGLPTDTDANGAVRIVDGTGARELNTASGAVVQVDQLGTQAKADVNAEADTALTDYDAPTKAELDSGLAALNNLTAAQVNAEVDTALADFFTSAATLVDLIWDEELTGGTHNVPNSAGRRIRQIQETGAVYGGFIWIDTVNGTAGTTAYENGTSDNPVDSIADANTLAAATGISRFKVAPGSSITLAATQANQVFDGAEWTLALGGQNIAGSEFTGATVSGIGTGADAHFVRCEIGTATLATARFAYCRLSATITFSAAGDYYFDSCYSAVAGSGTPVLDFGAAVANTNLSMRHYSGGIQIDNKDGAGTDQMSLEGNGKLVVSASSGGAISLRGNFKITNTGGATITLDDNSESIASILADTNELQSDNVPGLIAALNDLSTTEVGDAVLDEVTEGSTTLRQAIRIIFAAAAGKISGAATTAIAIRDEADSLDRITATVDADGNRSAVTLNKS